MLKVRAVPVLWRVGQWDNNILVNEDEEGQEEAEPHSTDNVHGWQALKRSHVEYGPRVIFKNWHCSNREKKNSEIYSACLYHCDISVPDKTQIASFLKLWLSHI